MSQSRPTEKEINAFARAFVDNGGNKSAAWRAAFPGSTAADSTAWVSGCRFYKTPGVDEAIEQARADTREAAKKKFDITIEDVLERWWSIATADPRELARVEKVACRYCHGFDHDYQWVDEKEFENRADKEADDWGGYGYSTTLQPASGCPRCHGKGTDAVWLADSRNLSKSGTALYAGAEMTRSGIKVKMQDQQAALRNLAHALGAFTDNVNVRSPDGSMTPTVVERRIVDPKA